MTVDKPVKIGNLTVAIEHAYVDTETFFLVIRKPDDPISGARSHGQPLFFFFSTSPLEVDAGKFSFYQFSKIMNFDDFLKRVSIAEAKQIYPESFFATEVRITNYKRLLTTAELDCLGKILENYDRLACSDKKNRRSLRKRAQSCNGEPYQTGCPNGDVKRETVHKGRVCIGR